MKEAKLINNFSEKILIWGNGQLKIKNEKLGQFDLFSL